MIATALWGFALIAAVAWPGRIVGPLDGAPFDTSAELLLLTVVLPALWWFHPSFLKTGPARTMVALLLVWKLAAWIAVPQGGWCGDFLMKNPPETGGWRLTRSWDARTIWEQTPASCSAIVARAYVRPTHFPGWAINIPYGRDRWLHVTPRADHQSGDFVELPRENPRPPAGEFRMDIHGAFDVASAGTLTILTDRGVTVAGGVDERPVSTTGENVVSIDVAPGSHQIDLQLGLSSQAWRFVPLWNGADVFSAAATTTRQVGRGASYMHRAGRWIAAALILALLVSWVWSALSAYRPGVLMSAVIAAVGAGMAWAASAQSEFKLTRLSVAALAVCLVVPVPRALRNTSGAWLLLGVPWLALVAAISLPDVGAFTLFQHGDDPLTYQRFAYRIYMERFWLEGGQPTFWYQPLYRWICGALHLLFGDSSAGEMVWDGFGLLVGAMFAFVVLNRIGSFRIGLAAAVAVLLTFSIGPSWYFVGRGLSEISALMWIYLASICLITATDTSVARGVLAGVFGALGYYTRMNHLLLVVALGAVALLDRVDAGAAWNVRLLWARLPKRLVGAYYATLAVGLCLFAARTWHYTGRFSLFAGTSLGFNAIGLGTTVESWWSMEAWRRAAESVAMLITVRDPPRFDWRSVQVVAGVVLSVLGLFRVPLARRLPLGPALMCVAAVAGGLVVRGTAYPGRFSIHLIPVAVTVSMAMLSLSLREAGKWRSWRLAKHLS